jgi:GH15 family glucan-1,4-alpha-glucosidase
MNGLDLGLIGNCAIGALIDRQARIVWCCWPRLDGDPVFNALLNQDAEGGLAERGFFAVDLEGLKQTRQRYEENTAILRTVLEAGEDTALEVVDFAPRYRHYDRVFRPATLVRLLRPLAGTPRIRIRLRPTFDYGALQPEVTRGSNHMRMVSPETTLRLTTNAPVSYIAEESWFLLEEPVTLVLGPDESLSESVPDTGRAFLERTAAYWRDWTRSLSIPFEWQDEVIRAAITLKLSTFEETGAIVAAMTTSIPEHPDSARTWDYRFCWLRDAYFVVQALNRLSATQTLEHYLRFIKNVAAAYPGQLQPLYTLTLGSRPRERVLPQLRGYRGMGPVRVGNDAWRQVQNDVFGSVVLAVTQCFFDRRLHMEGQERLYGNLCSFGEAALQRYGQPDAGLWELRTREAVHTFSALMCWAAVDRLARIARRLGKAADEARWHMAASTIREAILAGAWNSELNAFSATFGGSDLDASLLLMHELGFLAADDPRFVGTVAAVERVLKRGQHLFRYATADDFGLPRTAFIVCTFWYIEALAAMGRREEARAMFEHVLACRNSLGLLSEDIDPESGQLWGNFPQTYSMVGLIKCAMRLSQAWEDAF